jgi:hypothetical protein
MTKKEAIRWLKFDIEMTKFDPSTGGDAWLNKDDKSVIKAKEMAIEALRTIDTEPQWISCVDRLPVDSKNSSDCISKQAAYIAMVEKGQASKRYKLGEEWELNGAEIREALETVPSIQPEPEVKPISYQDCSNALLKMWMENVLTDGEYRRISGKLEERFPLD